MQERIIGIDHGKKRIGIAVSDPLGMTSAPVETIENNRDSISKIREILERYDAKKIVLGLPKTLEGEIGLAAETVIKFGDKLKSELNIDVVMYDERMTTAAVQKALIGADIKRSKRKELVDKMAAAYMLAGYLERNK